MSLLINFMHLYWIQLLISVPKHLNGICHYMCVYVHLVSPILCISNLIIYQHCTDSVKSRQLYLVRFIKSAEEITVNISQQSLCFMNHSLLAAQEAVNTYKQIYIIPSALIHLWVIDRPKSGWSIVLKTEQTKMEVRILQAFEHLRSTVHPSSAAPLEKKRPEAAWRDGWVPPYKHPERSTGCRRWDQC